MILQERRKKIVHESIAEDDRIAEQLKKEGRWIGGLGEDPPEIKENQKKMIEALKQLEKEFREEYGYDG